MDGAAVRRKGLNFEREVARMLRERMPGCDAKRGLGQPRSSAEVPDVDVPGFWIECKVGKRPPVREALDHAVECAARTKGRAPVAVVKEDRRPPFVVMPLEDWLDLVGEWWTRGMQ